MPRWIAVSRSQHAQKNYQPRERYHFAANQPVANVLLAELSKLVPHYALGFVEHGESYQPIALLSLDGHTNLYVHTDGRWLSTYVPAAMRGFPFTLANNKEGKQVLAIDQEHLSKEWGTPLFGEDGSLNEPVEQTLNFLQQCEQNRQVTAAATQKLAEAGVIESWPLELNTGEGQEPLPVNGLYRINEQALNGLEAQAYAELRGGPMALAYAQLFSMSQLNQLTERAKVRERHAEQNKPVDLDELFGEEDDDLSFNF